VSRLRRLKAFGQSPWLDDLHRDLLEQQLPRLMSEDGICGITSNPAILAKAVLEHASYRQRIAQMPPTCNSGLARYEALMVEDFRLAADRLRPVYEESGRLDGYVSLEIDPALAHDADGSVREARRWWQRLERPNVMIKIPATDAGLVAIRRLLAEGVNVNATLIFSPRRYAQVAVAWQAGIAERVSAGLPVGNVASVASFFVSRIETLADRLLEEKAESRPDARRLQGRIAVAAAQVTYREFRKRLATSAWEQLIIDGAIVQRPLWASTSTKNPDYSDVKYVDALIGPLTVTTLPLATIAAYRDHGQPALRLENPDADLEQVLEELGTLGIDFAAMAARLEAEGLAKFQAAWEQLLKALESA